MIGHTFFKHSPTIIGHTFCKHSPTMIGHTFRNEHDCVYTPMSHSVITVCYLYIFHWMYSCHAAGWVTVLWSRCTDSEITGLTARNNTIAFVSRLDQWNYLFSYQSHMARDGAGFPDQPDFPLR